MRSVEKSSDPNLHLKIIYRRIEELKPNPANPRRHTRWQIRQIGRSLKAFGFIVPVLIEALSTLSAGLSTIGHGYHIEKVISGEAKTDTEVRKELSTLDGAYRTVIDILDADLSGARQIEALLSDPWHGSQIPRIVEELRSLSSRIEPYLATLSQNRAIKKRQQDPETWFFLAVYDLFATITGNSEPGIAGPLPSMTGMFAAIRVALILL